MKTRFIEATQSAETGFNWGKVMIGTFDMDEWERRCALPSAGGQRLLHGRGWTPKHVLIVDLQTGEGAMFLPGGSASADLTKRKIWVCPMFEAVLEWLYEFVREHGDNWFDALPSLVELPDAPAAMHGYRRGASPQAI